MAGDSYSCPSGETIFAGCIAPAASAIGITDTAYQRVYQRVGASKSLPVAGTYSGSPYKIQARACPAGTDPAAGAVAYPWQILALNPTGGTFAGNISVPQGDDWIMQVRDGTNHALSASGTHAFGVGIVIGLLGQSNMENSFSSIFGWPLGSPHALVKSSTTTLQRIGAIKDSFPPSTLSPTYVSWDSIGSTDARDHGNAIVIMANDLVAANNDCPVVLLTYAASGTTSAQWQPGGAYLNAFFTGLDSVGGDCEAVIWLQGETDAQTGVSAATYQSNLQAIFDAIKAHTGRSSGFHFGTVVVGPAMASAGAWGSAWATEGNLAPIRKAQLDFVAANAGGGAFLAGTDIDGNLAGASAVHIDQTSLFRQGRRYTEALKRRFAGAANGIEGPAIASASRSGTTITVSINQHGGTALQDGAGGSGGSLQGFRVFDGGTPATISSTAISGNTVVLTLAATPTGTVTLDYAMANAPFGSTTAAAAVLYDNQSIPGDSLGLPLQPRQLLTVS